MSKEERKYCVYCHTNRVNGKKYVGITSRRPEARWGKNGICYKHSSHFYNAIQKFGWDNFEHNVLFEGMSREEAENKEIELIAEWNLGNKKFGYNLLKGGLTLDMNARFKLAKGRKGKGIGRQAPNYRPLIGKRFGMLLVVSDFSKNQVHYCVCNCDCGNKVTVRATNLRRYKHTQSCGCLRLKRMRESTGYHGMKGTRIYHIWRQIKGRCYNQNHKDYLKGIEVCDEWNKDFITFYNWAILSGYKDNLFLIRKDKNGDFKPSNCYWDIFSCVRGKRILCVETGIEYKSIKIASELTGVSRNSISANLRGEQKSAGSLNNGGKGFHFVYITDESPKEGKK